ncbi:MAG: hypothetical protein ACXWQA_14990, partial [Pseudobdellovibrionaceae bacterium]
MSRQRISLFKNPLISVLILGICMPIYGTAADRCSETFAFNDLQALVSESTMSGLKSSATKTEEKDFLSALPNFEDLATRLFDAIKNMSDADQNEYLVPLKKDDDSKKTIMT